MRGVPGTCVRVSRNPLPHNEGVSAFLPILGLGFLRVTPYPVSKGGFRCPILSGCALACKRRGVTGRFSPAVERTTFPSNSAKSRQARFRKLRRPADCFLADADKRGYVLGGPLLVILTRS